MQQLTDQVLMDRMRCSLKPGSLEGLHIEPFKVDYTKTVDFMRSLIHYEDRVPDEGTYTRLVEDVEPVPNDPHLHDGRKLWMSDTQAELMDHLEAARQMSNPAVERVLIHGLGLGCVVNVALSFPHIRHIDVVEYDWRVIRLVGQQLPRKLGQSTLMIHQGDAYTMEWAESDYWDVVWHDIWPDLSTTNLIGMHRLYEGFRDRAAWQGFWGRDLCVRQWLYEAALFKQVKKEHGGIPRKLRKTWKEHQAEKRYAEMEYDY
jgi:hypothetical protein